MVKRVNRIGSESAVRRKSTNGRRIIPARCEECKDDHQELDHQETDPGSSRDVQPEPSQLEVRPGILALAQGTVSRVLLCQVIAQMHAFAPTPPLLAPPESTRRRTSSWVV